MSSVNNIGNNSPVYTVNRATARPTQAPTAATTATPNRGADTVELSGNSSVSHAMKTLKAGGDFRADKVAAIKAQIASGTYETDEKLDTATDRLLDEMFKG